MWFKQNKNFNSNSPLDEISRRLMYRMMVCYYSFISRQETILGIIPNNKKHTNHTIIISMESPEIITVKIRSKYTSPRSGIEYTSNYQSRRLTMDAKEPGVKGIVLLVRDVIKQGMKIMEKELKTLSRKDNSYHKLSFMEYIKYKLFGIYPKIKFRKDFIDTF